MENVRADLSAWLKRAYPGSTLAELTGDASQRRFYRLTLPSGETRVVMDYGEPFEGETDDVRLTRVFRAARLPVAAIEAQDPAAGCLVLEDLGDWTLGVAIQEAESPVVLLRRAVLLAVDVAVRGTPALAESERSEGPALDSERFRFEMDFFLEHYVGNLRGKQPTQELRDRLYELADLAAETPHRILCHRDYHSRNVMVRPDGSLAMVDIQDARWGPDTYDLASLVYDAYLDLEPATRDRLIETFRHALPEPPDPRAFNERLGVVATQRMIKALGTFGYQIAVAGRDRYAEGIPRTLGRLSGLLPTCPTLVNLRATLDDSNALSHL